MTDTSDNVWSSQVEEKTRNFHQARADIREFVSKHDIDADSQHKCLVEELGELSEVLLVDGDTEDVAEEIGDVIFVAWTLALLHDVSAMEAVSDVAAENVQKDETVDGGKVTQSGLETQDE